MGDEAKNCQLPPPEKLLWAPIGNGTLHPSARVLGYSQRRKEDSFLLLFSFNLGLYCAVHGILVPQPRVKPMPPALKAQRPNHWTTREVPGRQFLRQELAELPWLVFLPAFQKNEDKNPLSWQASDSENENLLDEEFWSTIILDTWAKKEEGGRGWDSWISSPIQRTCS